jgi:hypothetical protein
VGSAFAELGIVVGHIEAGTHFDDAIAGKP